MFIVTYRNIRNPSGGDIRDRILEDYPHLICGRPPSLARVCPFASMNEALCYSLVSLVFQPGVYRDIDETR